MSTLSETTNNLLSQNDGSVDLSSFAEKPRGAWPNGWYPAEIIEGYDAGGYQFLTETSASKKGDSLNMKLCIRIKNGEDTRTNFVLLNYRSSDMLPETLEIVARLRAEMDGVRGKWVGFEDVQRSSLALGQLGQLQAATGVPLKPAEGVIDARSFIGVGAKGNFFVRLTTNESGYNEINAFSQYPTGTKRESSGKKSKR